MKFQPGQSGNPRGRPPGNSHRAVRQAIAEALPEVVEALITAAKAGSVPAAKVLLERVIPPLKPEGSLVDLGAPGELSGRVRAIVDAMLSGAVSATLAAEMLAVMALASRVVPEVMDGTGAIWMVPPEMPIEQWQQTAQAMARP